MQLPKEFTVIWRDKKDNAKHFETNNENTALNKAIKVNGTVYIDTRYKAKLRLYWYLWRKKDKQMKKLSNYEINEALNCLCELSNRIKNDYLHVSNVMTTELKCIDNKISKLYKELEKRQNLNN